MFLGDLGVLTPAEAAAVFSNINYGANAPSPTDMQNAIAWAVSSGISAQDIYTIASKNGQTVVSTAAASTQINNDNWTSDPVGTAAAVAGGQAATTAYMTGATDAQANAARDAAAQAVVDAATQAAALQVTQQAADAAAAAAAVQVAAQISAVTAKATGDTLHANEAAAINQTAINDKINLVIQQTIPVDLQATTTTTTGAATAASTLKAASDVATAAAIADAKTAADNHAAAVKVATDAAAAKAAADKAAADNGVIISAFGSTYSVPLIALAALFLFK